MTPRPSGDAKLANTRSTLPWGTLTLALYAALACSGGVGDAVGAVTVAITGVPDDVACVRITATGAARVAVILAPVTPGTNALVPMNGLPLGLVTFSGGAFATTCAGLEGTSLPSWQSDPVPATISASQVTAVALTLHRNGRASVSVGFDDDGHDAGSGGARDGGDAGTVHHGSFAYVLSGSDHLVSKPASLLVLDLETSTFQKQIELPGSFPGTVFVTSAFRVVLSPDGTTAYVSALVPIATSPPVYQSKLFVIDLAAGAVGDAILVSGVVGSTLMITADGKRIYLEHGDFRKRMAIIDPATRTLVSDVALTDDARPSALGPDGARFYGFGGHVLKVIDKASFAVMAQIPLSLSSPTSIAFSPDGATAYLGGCSDKLKGSAIVVVDLTAGAEVAAIKLPGQGEAAMVVTPSDGRRAYVAYQDLAAGGVLGKLATIDLTARVLVGDLVIGYPANSLAVCGDGARVCVGIYAGVRLIDTATNSLLTTARLSTALFIPMDIASR